jgi:trehalose 6-phosphate phosphatase
METKINQHKIILLLDYDGTLTPIVSTPDEAILHEDMRSVLNLLTDDPRFTVAIISGRSMSDVKSKVGLDGICYAGNHGMEIQKGDGVYIHPDARDNMNLIKTICDELRLLLNRIEGVIVEDKGLTASVHYRMTPPEDIDKVKRIVSKRVEPHVECSQVRLTHGKMVLEIRPNIDWDKGKAVEWVLASIASDLPARYFPVYIGDDRTDEDAFRVLRGRGLTVLVSSEKMETDAEYVVNNVKEVKEFLKWLGTGSADP